MTVDEMADEVSEFKQWKYVAEDATYDVSLLSEEAQGAFQMLLELNARQKDIAKLQKEVSIIVAASQAFNSIVNSLLTKDAIIDIDINEPVLPDEDDDYEGERPDHDWRVD